MCAALVGWSALAHAQNPPLAPRYTKGIGVAMFEPVLTIVSKSFTCTGPDGVKNKYTFESSLKIFLVIANVFQESPAHKAGLRCGDAIVGVNDRGVTSIEELRSALNSPESGERVRISFLRPGQTHGHLPEVLYIETWDTVTVSSDTHTIDWVAERAKEQYNRSDDVFTGSYGPTVTFGSRSAFTEIGTGVISYSCAMHYTGEHPVLSIESLYFSILGPDEKRPEIKSGGSFQFSMTERVETHGIPTLVSIPILVAVPVDSKKMSDFFKEVGGPVGRIETGRKDDWYGWRGSDITCYLPELVAMRIISRKNRVEHTFGKLSH